MFEKLYKKSALTRRQVHLTNNQVSVNASLSQPVIDYLSSQNPNLEFCSENPQAAIQVDIAKLGFSKHSEAFEIKSAAEKVTILANSTPGAWRGLNCIINLINYSRLAQGLIRDWPSLDLRGFHLDLSCVMFTKEFILDLIPKLSIIGINTILLEVSDKMIFSFMPEISHPDALNLDFWRQFEAKANDFFIEVVPLVQTFGHMGNQLKHKQLEKLQEKPGSTAVICPSQQNSLDFLEKLLIDAKQAFPKSRYLHVGLDEVGYTGSCQYCQDIYGKIGYGGVFGKHITRLHSKLSNLNTGMMMWADMLIAYPEICRNIPRDIIINDWQYLRYSLKCRDWFVFTGMKTPGMQETGTLKNIGKFPEDLFHEYEDYIFSGDQSKPFTAFPYTAYFRDQGFKVIGNPASKCVGSNFLVPDYRHRLPNVLVSGVNLSETGAFGMINTNWSCRATHIFSNSWLGIFAGAVSSWTGTSPNNPLLNRLFCQWILNTKDLYSIISLYKKLGTPLAILKDLYSWCDGPEHFYSPVQEKISLVKKQFSEKTRKQKTQYLNKLANLQSVIASFPEINGSNEMINSDLDITRKIFLEKICQEKQLLTSTHSHPSKTRIGNNQINQNFADSLSPHTLQALLQLLNGLKS